MLRVSKMADYALLITHELVKHTERLLTMEEIVAASGLGTSTVRKLLKQLVDGKIATSCRGVKGGYRLAQAASNITVEDVVAAIEGPVALTDCSKTGDTCGLSGQCELKQNWGYLNAVVSKVLGNITLLDMTKPLYQHPSATVWNTINTKRISR